MVISLLSISVWAATAPVSDTKVAPGTFTCNESWNLKDLQKVMADSCDKAKSFSVTPTSTRFPNGKEGLRYTFCCIAK